MDPALVSSPAAKNPERGRRGSRKPRPAITNGYGLRHADATLAAFNRRTGAMDKIAAALVTQEEPDMKRLIAAAGILALTAGAAFAASDTGKVRQIDQKNDAITLEDGKTFSFAEGVEADALKIGQTVEVTYDVKDGKMLATSIVAK
jgi:hypothetical protein